MVCLPVSGTRHCKPGETIEEAIENLKEAIELYLEDEDARILATGQVFTTTVEISVG